AARSTWRKPREGSRLPGAARQTLALRLLRVKLMRVLALDTSGQQGTAAIVSEGRPLAEVSFLAGHAQAEKMFPMLDALFALAGLEKHEIDLLAVGVGPGGFTSVRVGLSTVKGLSLARGVPVVGVPSLLALSRGLSPAGGLAAA